MSKKNLFSAKKESQQMATSAGFSAWQVGAAAQGE